MPWKTRRNGRRYYYATRREGARVVQHYCGGGEFGRLCSLVVEERGIERRRAEAEARAPLEADLRRSERLAGLTRAALALAVRAMEDAGYHRPNRSEWRRRRGADMSIGTTTNTNTIAAKPPGGWAPLQLRRELDGIAVDMLAEEVAEATVPEGAVARDLEESTKAIERQVRWDVEEHAGQLAGGHADDPIVQALALACALHHARWSLCLARAANLGLTMRQAEHYGRMAEREMRTFCRAAKTLEQVKHRLPDAVYLRQYNTQVNVGVGAGGCKEG